MARKQFWWCRATVEWQAEDLKDQLVVLPKREAELALQWSQAVGCRSWADVAKVAPKLRKLLREYAEELDWEGDEFRFDELPGFGDGDLPPAPQATMERSLPRELLERFALVERTTFSGDLAYFAGSARDDVVQWLTDEGYSAQEHTELAAVLQDPSSQLPQ